MNNAWQHAREQAAERSDVHSRSFERSQKIWQRLDPHFIGLLLMLLFVLVAAGWYLARVADTRGWLDPPVVQPVPDERLLTNMRAEGRRFVDSIVSPAAAELLVLSDDRQLHTLSTVTGLATQSNVPDASAGLAGEPVLLADGCAGRECETEQVFVVTDTGGLAMRRSAADWQVLLSDIPWTGADGSAVELSDVVAWAASSDGMWLLAAAGPAGLGLMNTTNAYWQPLPVGAQAAHTAADSQVRDIVFSHGSFWLGGTHGLARLTPGNAPRYELIDAFSGESLDLTVMHDGQLLALARFNCSGIDGCLEVRQVSSNGNVSTVVGELELHPKLSAAGLEQAVLQGDRPVAFGTDGAYVYIPARRTWLQLASAGVTAWHILESDRSAWLAVPGQVLLVRDGAVEQTYDIGSSELVQLFVTREGAAFGVTAACQVLRVSDGNPVTFLDPAIPDGAGFTTAAVSRETVAMAGPQGMALINPVLRRSAWVPAAQLPAVLQQGNYTLKAAGSALWAVHESAGLIVNLDLLGDWPGISVIAGQPVAVPGPLRSAVAGDSGLHLVDSSGVPYRLSAAAPGVPVQLAGSAGIPAAALISVASMDDGLMFTDGSNLWEYLEAHRTWQQVGSGPPGSRLSDITIGDGVFAVDTSGVAWRNSGQGWNVLVGDGHAAPFGLDQVSDALAAGTTIWYGGNGSVFGYDTGRRAITQVYSGGSGAVRLVSAGADHVIWHSSGQLFRNGSRTNLGSVHVDGAWPLGSSILVQADGNHVRTLNQDLSSQSCYFLGVPPPAGELVDAREVGADRLYVLTTGGAGVYDSGRQRWLAVDGPAPAQGSRVYRLGAYLLEASADTLRYVALADISETASCSTDPVTIAWTVVADVQSVSVSEADASAAILRNDGEVLSWTGSQFRTVLPAATPGPVMAEAIRLAESPNPTLTSRDGIWEYSTTERTWARTTLVGGPGVVAEVDVHHGQVTVWDSGGTAYGGFRNGAGGSVTLQSFNRLALPEFDRDPAGLIDARMSGDSWLFLFRDGLKEWDNRSRTWSYDLSFPHASTDWRVAVFAGMRALLDPDGTVWLLPERPSGNHTLAAVAYHFAAGADRSQAVAGSDRELWRVTGSGSLLRCPVTAGQDMGNCQLVAAAFRVPAGSIHAVYTNSPNLLLVTDAGVQSLAADRRSLTPMPELMVSGDSHYFTAIDGLDYWWNGPGQPLYRTSAGGTELIHGEVHALTTVGGRLLLDTADGLLHVSGGNLLPVQPNELLPQELLAAGEVWPPPIGQPNVLDAVLGAAIVQGDALELFPAGLSQVASGTVRVIDGANVWNVEGAQEPADLAALNAGWLSWQPASARFRFSGNQASALLTPVEAIQAGRFLPAHPGRAAYLGAGSFAVINAHGLWHYDAERNPLLQRLEAFGLPEGVARGSFLLPDGQAVDARTGAASPAASAFGRLFGDLTVSEQVRERRVTATVSMGNNSVSAAAVNGFAFDQRRDIGLSAGSIRLLTPLGVMGTSSLTGFDAGPAGIERLATDAGMLFAQAAGAWYSRSSSGWTQAGTPNQAWHMAQLNGLLWQRTTSGPQIAAVEAQHNWRAARDGLMFHKDRFIATAANGPQALLVSAAGTHRSTSLATLGAPVAGQPGGTRLDSLTHRPGVPVLWAETGAGRLVWDDSSSSWQQPGAEQPWAQRTAVQTADFRVQFIGPAAEAFMTVQSMGGSNRLAAFHWNANSRMPFDRATSIHAEWTAAGRGVVVGTEFGLRRFSQTSGSTTYSGLLDIALPVTDNRAALPVTSVGQPHNLDVLIANGAGACAAFNGVLDAGFSCTDPAATNELHVLSTAFWTWTKGASGVRGWYHTANGDLPIDLGAARFPHDDVESAVSCEGQRIELWRSQDVATHGSGTSAILRSTGLSGQRQLHCQATAGLLGGGTTFSTGTYAISESGSARFNGGWQPQSGVMDDALRQRQSGAVTFESSRLRLGLRAGQPVEEYRSLTDSWHEVPRLGGRSGLDTSLAVFQVDSQLHRLTPAGLVQVQLRGGLFAVDTSQLQLRSAADSMELVDCQLDILELEDGRTHTVPAAAGQPVRFRCADGRAYTGDATSSIDIGALTALDDDPFGTRTVIDEDGWLWVRSGEPARLEIALNSEPMVLSGGRFVMDEYRSLAAPFESAVELVTGNGWWRHAVGDLGLHGGVRDGSVVAPQTVVRVTADRDQGGSGALLCLAATGSAVLVDAAGSARGSVAECAEWTGSDGFWHYRNAPSSPNARALARGGAQLARDLQGGRFTDTQVMGAPLRSGDEILAPWFSGVMALPATADRAAAHYAVSNVLALFPDQGGAVAALTTSGASLLESGAEARQCPAMNGLPAQLAEGLHPYRIQVHHNGTASVSIRTAGAVRQLLLDCQVLTSVSQWAQITDTAQRTRFNYLAAEYGEQVSSSLGICMSASGMIATNHAGWAAPLPGLPANDLLAVYAAPDGRRVYVATRSEIYEVNVDAATSLLFDTGSSDLSCLGQMSVAAESSLADPFQGGGILLGDSGRLQWDSTGSGIQQGEPQHAGQPGGASVWASWHAPRSGLMRISTQGSDFDTLLAVYSGTQLDNLTQVAASDDADGTLQSTLTYQAEAGQVYHIAIDGYRGASGRIILDWQLE